MHQSRIETKTVDFVAAPGTPAPFPGPGAAFDFGYRAGEAVWSSGAETLTYPSPNGDARGFVYQSNQTTFEDGTVDLIGPNLVVGPQNIYNGYIEGVFPAYTVKKGDRFRASVGCAYGAPCYVTFKITYRIGNSPTLYTFWTWTEKNEGQVYYLDKDLDSMADKAITFILTLSANGSPAGDQAIWGHPRIVHTDTATSTPPSPTPLPPTAPPPSPATVFDFTADICAARWMTGASLSPQACPFSENDARGFALRVENPRLENGALDSAPGLLVAPQNKYNGYIQGFYPEYIVQPGDRFQASVGCAHGYACYVTYRLDYQINNGGIKILWQWSEKNEGKIYQLDKDLSSLAGKKVRFILTLLAAGPATNDRAIWGQPRIINPNAVPPTPTPEPAKVTGATVNLGLPATVYCGGPNPVDVKGAITVNGPTDVAYHWVMNGNPTAEMTVSYSTAGTYEIWEGAYKVDCGNHSAQLVITSPNAFQTEPFFYTIAPAPPPSGSVTGVTAFADVPPYVNCAGIINVSLVSGITTNGPANLTYHWEIGQDGVVTQILPEKTATFTTASTLDVSESINIGCGNHFARLAVTAPNPASAQVDFPLTIPTLLPIYDFNTFIAVGAIACSEISNYAWRTEPCNGESGGCWVSATPLFGRDYAGFFRHDGNTVCGLNLP